MSGLRILHVVPYYAEAWAYGGIPRLATTITRALTRRGHHVTVCTTDVRDQHARTASRPDRVGGVDVRVFPNVSNALAYHLQFFTPIGLRSFLRSSAHTFDVAHIHACHNLPGAFAADALSRARVPYVVQPNGTALPIERRIAAKRLFARTVGRRVLARAARVIAVSDAERAQLLTLGVADWRIATIPNPIDESEFETPPDGFDCRSRVAPDGGPLVVYLGKLTPRKGVEDLVRAFARAGTANATLLIAGNDMGSGSRVARLVERMGLGRRVSLSGLLAGPARLDALAAADVVVYPSRDEVFGLVPLEALLCGAPVIVCGDSGCGEVISTVGGGLIVPHGDVCALTDAMDAILARRDEWRTRARSAADTVRRLYSSDAVCAQLEEVYSVTARRGFASRGAVGRGCMPRLSVSFVIPVLNGRRLLRSCVESILAEAGGHPFEIIAIDDGSTDGSLRLLEAWQADGTLTLLHGERRGAAAAINAGIRAASHPIVCQVDQDVVLQRGWLEDVLRAFADSDVAAAQGHYMTKPGAGFWARAMGRDLEHRYSRIRAADVDHVCTGNTAYRVSALRQVGLLDEELGYGYDNDLSYRLSAGGYKLAFRRRAISIHQWREGFIGYLRQQFGVGYGRIDVVARHPRKVTGDDVSGTVMMAHGPLMLAAVTALLAAAVLFAAGVSWQSTAGVGAGILVLLAAERTCAGLVAWRRTGDATALGFAIAHLARDLAWAYAIALWTARRVSGRRGVPSHSMHRGNAGVGDRRVRERPNRGDLLAVVPAFNEGANLRRVVTDLSRVIPREDILIVNDGSTDDTEALLSSLGVRWLTLSQRLGVGGAVRTGIRYAHRAGYRYVVRVDGDGQHRACDIPRLLRAVASGRADVALGSRFLGRRIGPIRLRRFTQALLAACLTIVTRRRVTDPTSGFWLFGPSALRLLGGHHPAGYAEPELVLFLHRNRQRVVEVPIRMRPRLGGRTSRTATRARLA
jgi:glycosyltransferase involved in cell wall biosynthesis